MTTTAKRRNKFRSDMMRLRARAFRRHGISREEFGRLTPADLHLLDRDEAEETQASEKIQNLRNATLLSAIYNAPHAALKKLTKPADFLPQKQVTDEEIAAKVIQLHAAFGG